MSFAGLFTSIEDVIASIGDETNVDQAVLDDVKGKLAQAHASLESIHFGGLQLPSSVFGGADTGNTLGYHHGKAHQVVADTLTGVLADLTRFRDGIVHAERLVEEADTSSADELNRKREAVGVLVAASSHSEGDRLNRESRNLNLGDGGGR